MGEPQRSLVTTGVLSTQQLRLATDYLKQLFSGLVALTQINSGDLSEAIEQVLQSGQNVSGGSTPSAITLSPSASSLKTPLAGTSPTSLRSTDLPKPIDLQRQDKLVNYFFAIPSTSSVPDSINKTVLTQVEIAIFVQACSYLCQQHQELIRRAVSLMEQLAGAGNDPWQATLLKTYTQNLRIYYSDIDPQKLQQLGAKLLLDLLFYSSVYGQRRLWRRCTEP